MNKRFLSLILLTTGSVCAGDRSPSPAAFLVATTIAGAARTAGPEMPIDRTRQPLISDRSIQVADRARRDERAALLAAAKPNPAQPNTSRVPKNGFRTSGILNQPGRKSVLDSGRNKEKQQRSPRK